MWSWWQLIDFRICELLLANHFGLYSALDAKQSISLMCSGQFAPIACGEILEGLAMKLYGVRIFVDDMDKARHFYADVLGLSIVWDAEAMGAFGVDLGAQLIVERGDPSHPEEKDLVGRFVGVSLEVENIDTTFENLTARGGALAHFYDSSGNVLTLVSGLS